MTATAPQPGPSASPMPPDEQFWQKYSPHYEFPLSSVGSIALHVAGVLLFLGALWLVARMSVSDTTAVPMTEMALAGVGNDLTPPGGDLVEGVQNEQPKDRIIPEATLGEIPESFKDIVRPKTTGKPGTGPVGGEKVGPVVGKGDPASSGSRGARWELNFKTESGRDYLNQLAALKATVVVPFPPDWKSCKAFTDLGRDRPSARDFDRANVPGLYFVDSDPGSVERLVKALGLDFVPPLFIAFFPKEVENELAAKERAFAGRKESDIALTRFRVLVRDGKPSVTVIGQDALKK